MRDQIDFSRELERLSTSAWAYAALAAALESGLLERLAVPIAQSRLAAETGLEAELVDDLLEALLALGVIEREGRVLVPTPAFETLCSPSVARVLEGEIRADHLQIQQLLERVREGQDAVGWSTEDPVALAAQGETGSLIGLLVEALLPRLHGLGERMSRSGARILDVGAGVGVVATELCRLWPEAEAVGLEPHRTARELGRSRIAADGLADRIALRDERLELLGETDAYDLAFVPQPFLSHESIEAGLPRIWQAMRPGGWLIVLAHELPADDQRAAAARRFRARVWGGGVIAPDDLAALIADAGFESVHSECPVGSFQAICACAPEHSSAAATRMTRTISGWDTAAP